MGTGAKEVKWNPTENVGAVDLGDMQRFQRAFATDWTFAQAGAFYGVGEFGLSDVDRRSVLSCMGDSAAPIPAGGLVVGNVAGPLIYWKAGSTSDFSAAVPSTWGDDTFALVYWTSPNELITTHAAADPSNPRWDLVCIRLNDVEDDVADSQTRLSKQVVGDTFVISAADFFKRRKVTLTKQVVQGTPAASPVMPVVPDGFKPYYAVKIGAGAGSIPIDFNFVDYRMPLGSFVIDKWARDTVAGGNGFDGVNNFPLAGGGVGTQTGIDQIPVMSMPPSSVRLLAVSCLTGAFPAIWNTANLGAFDLNAAGGGFSQPSDALATYNLTPFTASFSGPAHSFLWSKINLFSSLPAAGTRPVWGTGFCSGYASRWFGTRLTQVGVRYTHVGAVNSELKLTRFHFAGMPY